MVHIQNSSFLNSVDISTKACSEVSFKGHVRLKSSSLGSLLILFACVINKCFSISNASTESQRVPQISNSSYACTTYRKQERPLHGIAGLHGLKKPTTKAQHRTGWMPIRCQARTLFTMTSPTFAGFLRLEFFPHGASLRVLLRTFAS